MAVSIIDLLETIEVKHDDAKRLLGGNAALKLLSVPWGFDPGQSVVRGALLGGFQLALIS